MKLICQLTKAFEEKIAREGFLFNLCFKYYEKMVQREISLGSITSKDSVLCIGGGPVPCTAIEIAKKTSANVVVIDNDPCAVRLATAMIKRLKLDDKIQVIQSGGEKVPLDGYTVVHVAKQVTPRQMVIDRIVKTADIGARVLIRNTKPFMKNQYTPIQETFFVDNESSSHTISDWCSQTYLWVKN